MATQYVVGNNGTTLGTYSTLEEAVSAHKDGKGIIIEKVDGQSTGRTFNTLGNDISDSVKQAGRGLGSLGGQVVGRR